MWCKRNEINMYCKDKTNVTVPVINPKEPVVPDSVRRLPHYYRGKLGESLNVKPAEFDLSDPNMHVTCGSYNSLHDPLLKSFFNQPQRKKLLLKHALINEEDQVLCSLKDFSQYMEYLRKVDLGWQKLHQQEQKQLSKVAAGEVPENINAAHAKKLLISRGRTTFRNKFKKFMNSSSNQKPAKLVNQRLQLEKLEKEVIRELQLEQRPEPIPTQSVISGPGIPCTPGPSSSSADDQGMVTLLDQDSSSSGSPRLSLDQFNVKCNLRNSKSPNKVPSRVTVNFVSGIQVTITEEVQKNLLPALMEYSQPVQPTSVDLQQLQITPTEALDNIKLDSAGNKIDCSEDLKHFASAASAGNSIHQLPLFSTAELLVLVVLNASVFQIKRQQYERYDETAKVEIVDLASQFSDQDISIELPSPSLVSSPGIITAWETDASCQLFISEESLINRVPSIEDQCYGIIQSQTTTTENITEESEIDEIIKKAVGQTLESVISILESQGLLSSESDEVQSSKSSSSDSSSVSWASVTLSSNLNSLESINSISPSPTQCPGSMSPIQLSADSKEVLTKTLVEIQRKLSSHEPSVSPRQVVSPDNTDAIMDLISGILRRIQESSSSDSSLQGSSTSLKSITTPVLNNQMVQLNTQELLGQSSSKSDSLSSLESAHKGCKIIFVKSADMSARTGISLDERPRTCPLPKDSIDLKETMRQILSEKYQNESEDNLTDLLSDALYKHIQSKCQSEISGLNEGTSSQDECNLSPSNSVTSSDLEVASSALTELVLNDLKGTFDKKVENFKFSQNDIKPEIEPTLEKLLDQPLRSETDLIITEVTDEDFSSEGSIGDINDSNRCPEVASQIIGSFEYDQILKKAVDKTARKVLIEFSLPESFSVKEFSTDTEWLRSLTSEAMRLRSLIVEGVLENLSQNASKDAKNEFSEHNQSMPTPDANTAENYTDALGVEVESVNNVPENQNGFKQKKRRTIRAFFRRAWQAVKQTFTLSKKRSSKIFPA